MIDCNLRPTLGIALLLLTIGAHAADTWPSRPIRLIAPFPAGSSVDAAARVITPRISETLGQSIVIDNRAGAAGAIGAELGARAAPDGYTIAGGTTSTHALSKALNPHLSYDPEKDFIPITMIGHLPYILAVHPSVAATSLPELIGDREKLIQAVLNIARNAVQAMQNKGEIIFRTRAERQATLAKKRYRVAICLQIIDNGPGIPAEIRDRIFYPLVSGRTEGSGLGLTLAQTFITQHHGMIECESAPGHTCFTILLPIESSVMVGHIIKQ
jgi:signal transduction histidine kinase